MRKFGLYVVGFMFDSKEDNLISLIQKTKPEWQKGLLNGIGGKVEENEEPIQAMTREFYEETGAFIQLTHWTHIVTLIMPNLNNIVYFYKCSGDTLFLKCTTEEKVMIVDSNNLPNNTISNLKWIIPMMKNTLNFPIVITDYSDYSEELNQNEKEVL